MWSWLASLPWIASTAIILTTVLGACFVVFMIIKFIYSASFENKKFKLSFRKNNNAPDSHAVCPNVSSILALFHEFDEYYTWKHEIEYLLILSDQMRESETFIQSSYDLLLSSFIELIREKKGNNVNIFEQVEYKAYLCILNIEKNKVQSFFRRFFKENHMAEKSEKEFEEYKKDRVAQIIATNKAFFEEHYFANIFTPSVMEVNAIHVPLYAQIEVYLGKAFDKARDISIDYQKEIIKKKKVIDEKYKNTFGLYPSYSKRG